MEDPNVQSTEDIKKEFEVKKLKHEVKELKKFWLFRPQYIASILPTFLALISVIIVVSNNAYDVKTKSLELKRERLDYQIEKFKDSAKIIEDSLGNLKLKLKSIEVALDDITGPFSDSIPNNPTKNDFLKFKKRIYELQDNVAGYEGKIDMVNEENRQLRDSLKVLKRLEKGG